MAEADPRMRVMMLLAERCGLRDRELQHVEFSDINWREQTLRIQGKEKWEFKVKAEEQRDIPPFNDTLATLREWRATQAGQSLILGNESHEPDRIRNWNSILRPQSSPARDTHLGATDRRDFPHS